MWWVVVVEVIYVVGGHGWWVRWYIWWVVVGEVVYVVGGCGWWVR